ncbi:PREDICTED: tripartite motif-containing protein 40 [Condylura cristata]|uniref:tripartite motif-containing protein 40 n=1 Tax=Condylura cristata TaxID=143302 RepID=UPI0003346DD0|nr:PREDICTED: tripartite motif-containing protein 40 [Condylura cristata]
MVPLRESGHEEDICPICREGLRRAVRTACGHLFCQACLAQHVDKASQSGVLCCPVCRKPCSEGVLGTGYTCHIHQKKVRCFCEESRLLLCEECEKFPEHESHRELTIEEAISHYKERLSRKSRKVRKALGDLNREQLQPRALEEEKQQTVQWPDQPEDVPAEAPRTPEEELDILVTVMERMAKELDASKLKDASDLLDRLMSVACTAGVGIQDLPTAWELMGAPISPSLIKTGVLRYLGGIRSPVARIRLPMEPDNGKNIP